LPAILASLRRLLRTLENENVPYMIIGGYALPFYGRIRATVDIDLAVAIENQEELDRLCSSLQSNSFQTTMSSPKNLLIMILDLKEKVEMELWLRPDGIVFDAETLKRRRRAKLDAKTDGWIVSPEDFITNKLARPDRSVVDEQDVKSVLVRQEQQLDYAYLKRRAKDAGVAAVLDSIRAR
jgi:hypothetical protein